MVDCGSSDGTRLEIKRFLESEDFKKAPFLYQYVEREYPPTKIKDWNEPVRLANGHYIAMLEGDDQFCKNHLSDAYEILSNNNNIGLYATGNQLRQRKKCGWLSSEEWVKHNIKMKDVPPPSEAIFVRKDKNGNPFLYNDEDYEYAPEMDIYVRISLAGFDAYFSDKQDVLRDTNSKSWYVNTWHFLVDRFVLLKKFKCVIDNNLIRESTLVQLRMSIIIALRSGSLKNIIHVLHNCIQLTSFTLFLTSGFRLVKEVLFRQHHND